MAGRAGKFTAKTGKVYTYEEVRTLVNHINLRQRYEDAVELTGKQGEHMARKLKGTTKNPLKKAARKVLEGRQAVDNEARFALTVQNLMDGLSIEDAAQEVGTYLFHYNETPTFFREYVRRLIPFATFTHKNIKLNAQLLRKHPGMVINRIKPFRGTDEDNSQMVKWEAEGLKLRLERDGKTARVITGIDLPLRNLDFLWRGNTTDTMSAAIGMLTPAIKAPLEWVTEKDFFTGRGLTRKDNAMIGMGIEYVNPPQGVKDWLGYKKEVDDAGRPRYSFDGKRLHLLTNSWIFSRIISTSDRQFREYMKNGDMNFMRAALDVTTGLRMKDLNLDEQKARMYGLRIREIQDALARRGVLPQFTTTGKTPQELEP